MGDFEQQVVCSVWFSVHGKIRQQNPDFGIFCVRWFVFIVAAVYDNNDDDDYGGDYDNNMNQKIIHGVFIFHLLLFRPLVTLSHLLLVLGPWSSCMALPGPRRLTIQDDLQTFPRVDISNYTELNFSYNQIEVITVNDTVNTEHVKVISALSIKCNFDCEDPRIDID